METPANTIVRDQMEYPILMIPTLIARVGRYIMCGEFVNHRILALQWEVPIMRPGPNWGYLALKIDFLFKCEILILQTI